MNITGKYHPDPHPDWGPCVEELLFHTSRYACYAEAYAAALGGRLALAGYSAARLSAGQRAAMTRLLARSPSPLTITAVDTLVRAVAQGNTDVPSAALLSKGNDWAPPFLRQLIKRTRTGGLPQAVPPEDPLRHLAALYRFNVVFEGRAVWIDCERCNRLMAQGGHCFQENLLEALRTLNRAGYWVHGRISRQMVRLRA